MAGECVTGNSVIDMVTIPSEIYKILKTRKRRPVLTLSLVALLILVFALQQIQVVRMEDFGFIPAFALSKPWTFVTSIFLHSGFDHLLYNLLSFIWFGTYLESATSIRRRNILIAFFLSEIVSNFLFLAIAPSGVGAVGASGAIFGLLGVLLFVAPEFFPLALVWVVVGFILDPAYVNHLVGLLTGISLGIYWRIRKSEGFT